MYHFDWYLTTVKFPLPASRSVAGTQHWKYLLFKLLTKPISEFISQWSTVKSIYITLYVPNQYMNTVFIGLAESEYSVAKRSPPCFHFRSWVRLDSACGPLSNLSARLRRWR